MGHMTNARLIDFADRSGIQPATGEDAERLEAMSKIAYKLIRAIERELSGIRDGDGFWHGSDPLDSLIRQLSELYARQTYPDDSPFF